MMGKLVGTSFEYISVIDDIWDLMRATYLVTYTLAASMDVSLVNGSSHRKEKEWSGSLQIRSSDSPMRIWSMYKLLLTRVDRNLESLYKSLAGFKARFYCKVLRRLM